MRRAYVLFIFLLLSGIYSEISAAGSAIVDSTKIIRVADPSVIGPASSPPAIGKDCTLYLGSLDNHVYAFNPDLTLKWKFWTNQSIMSSPVIGRNGTIYVGSMDNYLYALDSSGALKWKFKTGGSIMSSPVLGGNGEIYLESCDGYLYALSTAGSLIWQLWIGTYTNPESATIRTPSVGRDGTIYLAAGERYFYAVNPDGTLKEKFFFGFPLQISPAIGSDETIYFPFGHTIIAFNSDCTLKWYYEQDTEHTGYSTERISSLAIDISGTIYFSIDNYFCALNPDGTLKWIHEENEGHSFSSIAIGKDGTIYTGCILDTYSSEHNRYVEYGVIYAFDPNGTLKWQSPKISEYYHGPAGNLDFFSPLTMDTKGIIYFTLGGFNNSAVLLHALDSGTNAGLADSPWLKWGHDIENSGNAAGVSGSLPGDVNADGSVDIFDILTIVKFALGKKTPTSQERTLADMNADGKIDVVDVLACMNKALGRTLQLAAYSQTDIAQLDLAQLKSDLVSLGAEPELIEDIFQLLDQNQPVPSLPKVFSLGQNSPNPFNPSTTISYSVPEGPSVKVSLKIYDLRGRLVRTLVEEMRDPGTYNVVWDGRDENGQQLSSGVYLYRMRAGEFVQTRKMVLLK